MKKHIHYYTTKYTEPRFYIIPKLHKTPIAGRPIVPSHSWMTSGLSRIADYLLRPALNGCTTVLRDTKQLVNIIEKKQFNTQDILLVTADVNSLYTNISISDCIEKLSRFTYLRGREYILEMINIVLKYNYFKDINEMWYHQIHGIAMGTPIAPLIANLYMYQLEMNILNGTHTPILYVRYIDDILMVWNKEDGVHVTEWLDGMTRQAPSIKFTTKVSNDEIDFLDLTIYKGSRFRQTGFLDIKTHEKELNKYLYIPFSSKHTMSARRSFIKTELIRHARNCSSAYEYNRAFTRFQLRLIKRNYPIDFIMEAAESVKYSLRSKYLEDSTPRTSKIMYCPLTFSKNIATPLLRNELGKLKRELEAYNDKWDTIEHFGIAWKSEDNIHKIIQKEYSKQRRRKLTYQNPGADSENRRKRRPDDVEQQPNRRKIHRHTPPPDDAPDRPDSSTVGNTTIRPLTPIMNIVVQDTTTQRQRSNTTQSYDSTTRHTKTTATTPISAASTKHQTLSPSTTQQAHAAPTDKTQEETGSEIQIQYTNTTVSIPPVNTSTHQHDQTETPYPPPPPPAPTEQTTSRWSVLAYIAERTRGAAINIAVTAHNTLTSWRTRIHPQPTIDRTTGRRPEDSNNTVEPDTNETHRMNQDVNTNCNEYSGHEASTPPNNVTIHEEGSEVAQSASAPSIPPTPQTQTQVPFSNLTDSPTTQPKSRQIQPQPGQTHLIGTTDNTHPRSYTESRLREVALETLRARTTFYTKEYHTNVNPIVRYRNRTQETTQPITSPTPFIKHTTNESAQADSTYTQTSVGKNTETTYSYDTTTAEVGRTTKTRKTKQGQGPSSGGATGQNHPAATTSSSPHTPAGAHHPAERRVGVRAGQSHPDPWASFYTTQPTDMHICQGTPAIRKPTENDIQVCQADNENTKNDYTNQTLTTTRQRWTDNETQVLLSGIQRHGTARWTKIYEENREIFKDRDPAKLKDRFRNLIRRPEYEHLADDYNKNKRRRTMK